jgi:S-formylglutathione hydrolase FrmB
MARAELCSEAEPDSDRRTWGIEDLMTTWRVRSSRALRRWQWTGWVLLAAACMVGCGAPSSSPTPAETLPPASASTSSPPTQTVAATARIVETKTLGRRITDLTIESPAVGAPVQVRLLLPARFQAESKRRWPVLYLLPGCCDTYVSWTRSTDIEQLSRKHDLLVVMPDGGKAGFYSNWRIGPQWETFHTQELPQLLVSQYRASGKAAIAGVSMGGLGALGYAARHPGSYAAASFSGIVHTRLSSDVSQGYLGLVSSQGAAGSSCCRASWTLPHNRSSWRSIAVRSATDNSPRRARTAVVVGTPAASKVCRLRSQRTSCSLKLRCRPAVRPRLGRCPRCSW